MLVKCPGFGVLGINNDGIHPNFLANQTTPFDGIHQQDGSMTFALLCLMNAHTTQNAAKATIIPAAIFSMTLTPYANSDPTW